MQKRLIATFMVALMLLTVLSAVVSVNAVSIEEETAVSTNTETAGASIYAFLYGRIENLYEDWYIKEFDAVNLYIVSLMPLGFYHLNSGEEVRIECFAPDGFVFFGILTDNIIFALCGSVFW